ncbi:MAG: hypothetical protein ABSG94_12265 [Brevinematales bacterium]|jgi:hypothetical protein
MAPLTAKEKKEKLLAQIERAKNALKKKEAILKKAEKLEEEKTTRLNMKKYIEWGKLLDSYYAKKWEGVTLESEKKDLIDIVNKLK